MCSTRTPARWTFLRPTFFMQNLTGQALNGVLVGATRAGRVGMVDARDVAAAAAAALTVPVAGNRIHTLTTSPDILIGINFYKKTMAISDVAAFYFRDLQIRRLG